MLAPFVGTQLVCRVPPTVRHESVQLLAKRVAVLMEDDYSCDDVEAAAAVLLDVVGLIKERDRSSANSCVVTLEDIRLTWPGRRRHATPIVCVALPGQSVSGTTPPAS